MFPWETSLFFYISRNISKVPKIYIYIYISSRSFHGRKEYVRSERTIHTVNVRSGRHAPIAAWRGNDKEGNIERRRRSRKGKGRKKIKLHGS